MVMDYPREGNQGYESQGANGLICAVGPAGPVGRLLHMRLHVFLLILLQCLLASFAYGAKSYPRVQVADPYIELHTGPGRGYPIFFVVDRGDWVEILKRRTDSWFKVRTGSGKEGWVRRRQMEQTLTVTGEATHFVDSGSGDFAERRWEVGAMGGRFKGNDVMTVYGGFAFTPNLSAELAGSKIFGDFSDADMATVSIVAQPFPNWRVSPFFSLGTGVIHTDPKTTLVQEDDRTDQVGNVGIGFRTYLLRRFVFRAQYKYYVIFQSKDENQEINEWKAGFTVFF